MYCINSWKPNLFSSSHLKINFLQSLLFINHGAVNSSFEFKLIEEKNKLCGWGYRLWLKEEANINLALTIKYKYVHVYLKAWRTTRQGIITKWPFLFKKFARLPITGRVIEAIIHSIFNTLIKVIQPRTVKLCTMTDYI